MPHSNADSTAYTPLPTEAAPSGRAFPFWVLPLAASLAYGAWLYPRLPDSVPVHWNIAGEADRYGSPAEAAFLLPVVLAVLIGLMQAALPRLMPATPDYAATRRVYEQIVMMVLCFMLYMQVITAQAMLGRQIALTSWVVGGAGALFVLMGNLLPKLKRNVVAGVRLPWALRDDVVWAKSQRAGGWAFVILGLVLVFAAPLPGFLPLAIMLAGLAIAVSFVTWQSWLASRGS